MGIFEVLHIFIIQILEGPSLSGNKYDLNGISFLLKELQAARARVYMDSLQILSSFYTINPFFRGSLITELLRNANDKYPAELRMVFRMRRALSKPLILIDAITKLVKLARSPNISKIFRNFAFSSAYLEGKKAPTLPDKPAVWKQRFCSTGMAGSRHDDDQIDQKILSICIDQAIASRGTVAVLAEVNILSYMHKKGLMSKAMIKIGVNKLSCPGCF